MTKTLISSLITGLLLLAGSSTVLAQDEESFKVIPVEMFACTYNENKGPADLDKAVDNWNAWADKKGWDSYAAWTLTPYYYGPEQEFDVLWLGAGTRRCRIGQSTGCLPQRGCRTTCRIQRSGKL